MLVSGDLDPGMAQFIVTDGGRDFAYLQGYRLSDWHTGSASSLTERAGSISSSEKLT